MAKQSESRAKWMDPYIGQYGDKDRDLSSSRISQKCEVHCAQDENALRRSTEIEVNMADEKTQGAGTATEEAPGENTIQVTFLPDGKTVQFERGKLPYEDHGKE